MIAKDLAVTRSTLLIANDERARASVEYAWPTNGWCAKRVAKNGSLLNHRTTGRIYFFCFICLTNDSGDRVLSFIATFVKRLRAATKNCRVRTVGKNIRDIIE